MHETDGRSGWGERGGGGSPTHSQSAHLGGRGWEGCMRRTERVRALEPLLTPPPKSAPPFVPPFAPPSPAPPFAPHSARLSAHCPYLFPLPPPSPAPPLMSLAELLLLLACALKNSSSLATWSSPRLSTVGPHHSVSPAAANAFGATASQWRERNSAVAAEEEEGEGPPEGGGVASDVCFSELVAEKAPRPNGGLWWGWQPKLAVSCSPVAPSGEGAVLIGVAKDDDGQYGLAAGHEGSPPPAAAVAAARGNSREGESGAGTAAVPLVLSCTGDEKTICGGGGGGPNGGGGGRGPLGVNLGMTSTVPVAASLTGGG